MSKFQRSLQILFSFSFLISFLPNGFSSENQDLFKYEYIKPFLWGESTDGHPGYYDLSVQKDTMKLHPLGLGKYAFISLWYGERDNNPELMEIGRKYVDFLAKEYPHLEEHEASILYNYPFSNKELKAGEWHSGMANSIIALSFLQASILYDEPVYLDYAELAMRGVTNTLAEGGSALNLDKGKWFLEYAGKSVNHDNARFVLNGFLYQLLALKLYGNYTGDEYFISEYESGLLAYQQLYDQFHYASKDWTYYSLNPKSVEPPHYVIFDITLLDALYELTGELIFESESAFRRNVLKAHYDLEYTPLTKTQDIYLFSQLGAPNPYWVDIYRTTLRFNSKLDDKVMDLNNPREFHIPIEARCFRLDTLKSEEFSTVEVWAKYITDSVLLFESMVNEIRLASRPNIVTDYELSTKRLAEKEAHKRITILNPATDKGKGLNSGILSIELDQVFDGYADKYLGIVLNSQSSYKSLRIFLTNSMNERASRYYINTLEPGIDNLILISVVGLKHIDQLTNREFTTVELHFYNEPLKTDSPYSIEIKDIVYFPSNTNLYSYLKRSYKVDFKEKDNPGFLY